jgi:hypothetical protein
MIVTLTVYRQPEGEKPMQDRKQVQELTSEELELVTGAATEVCLYNDKAYSPGSVVDMSGGARTCQSDGTWKK